MEDFLVCECACVRAWKYHDAFELLLFPLEL